MVKRIGFWLMLGLMVVVLAGGVWAAVPAYINIQGRVTQNGSPPPSISSLTFTAGGTNYDALDTSNSPNFSYNNTTGIFNATLGPVVNPAAFSATEVIITVNGSALPAQKLQAVPYAFQAKIAEDNVKKSGDTMTGTLSLNVSGASALIAQSGSNPSIVGIGSGVGISGAGTTGIAGSGNQCGIWGYSSTGHAGYFSGGKGVKIEGTLEVTKAIKEGGMFLIDKYASKETGGYVKKAGDTMTGTLSLNVSGANALIAQTTSNIGIVGVGSGFGVSGSGKTGGYFTGTNAGVVGYCLNGSGVTGLGKYGGSFTGTDFGVAGYSPSGSGGGYFSGQLFGIVAKGGSCGIWTEGSRNYFSGKVGIGKSDPLAKLDVEASTGNAGSFLHTSVVDTAAALIANTQAFGGAAVYGITTYAGSGGVRTYEKALHGRSETGYGLYTEAPYNYFSGKVGIGTTEVASQLRVQGGISGGNMLLASSSASKFDAIASTINTYNSELIQVPIHIPPGTTRLRGSIRYKSAVSTNSSTVSFKVSGVESSADTSNSIYYHSSGGLLLNVSQSGWQDLSIYARSSVSGGGTYINSFTIYTAD